MVRTEEFNVSTAPSTAAGRADDFIAFVNDRKTEQILRSFAQEQAMPRAHIAIGTVDDAVAYLSKIGRSPLFLLVDLEASVMPLSDLGRLAEVCEPSVHVVALGSDNDVGLFRSLLKLGVRDYLVKPLTVELLKRTVSFSEGKINPVALARAGKTIVFAGTRGGVGVTTLALGLARDLADRTNRRVAYVDLNIYGGGANSMLGIQSNNGLVDVLQNVHRLDAQYLERTLVAKGNRLFMLSAELAYGAENPFNAGGLHRILGLLCDSFHYVILDADDPNSSLARQAYDHASKVYLVTERSVHSVHQTIRLLRFIAERESDPPISLLLNNPNAANAGKVQAADFASAVGRGALHEIAFEPKALTIAENLGEAPNEKAPNGFNHTITRIADDLTGKQPAVKRTLWQRLMLRKM
jgi:pilus assembly protein CpaE